MSKSGDAKQQVMHELMQQLESDHCQGAPDAPLILLEYGDFECESCASAQLLTKNLIESFGDRMKLIFRHYPLTELHPHAELAAEAAEAAAAQGRFWEMYGLLFRNCAHLKLEHMINYAQGLELDILRFKAEMRDRIYLQRVQEHRRSGDLLELRTTPAFFLNGKMIDVRFGLDHLKNAVWAATQMQV